MRDLKYTGVGCAQYLVAPDGETAFLEINPRLGANHEAVRAAGLDLAAAAVDIALGDEPQVPKTARPGVRYAWGLGDLDAIVRALRHREIGFGEAARWFGRTLRSVRAADTHVVWQRTDPRPGAALMWAVVVRPLLGVLASRLSGRRA